MGIGLFFEILMYFLYIFQIGLMSGVIFGCLVMAVSITYMAVDLVRNRK